ncbi:hypothetical protein Pmani_028541 [Petrolisthes manimaculis]|uniref:DNA-repair protein Xrcc1 N-terminal domain-containing protein n=1 Tax=Petrolisthes manimaculis TaxID=1843537 RepID=A0AAE1TXY3_9EUCA|nr:hypothetical protein Pmani_028541 [Petrolisthes manimaculis]
MPPVRVKHVISFSSQDPKHTVEGLVRGRGSWLSQVADKTSRLQADLQLGWATTISYIDVGNAGSVMVSVEVGRSSWPTSQPMVTLLPAASLVSPEEWRAGKNRNSVRMFKPDDLDKETRGEKWDKVRIICLQPFRKDGQFGLSLFRLHTSTEVNKEASPNIVIDFVEEPSGGDSKRETLVAKMNLPIHKKNTISQKIGWLEKRVVGKGVDQENTCPTTANPFTSPVSRAARLLSMAAPITSMEDSVIHKQDLEQEAIEFLISLNLTINDIYSLKVIEVRQNFEKKQKKELELNEKKIFKEIALDYAKRRLEILESEEERKEQSNEYVRKQKTPRTQSGKVKKEADHFSSRSSTVSRSMEIIEIEDVSKKPRNQQYLRQQQSSPRNHPVKRKQDTSHTTIGDDFDSFEAAKRASVGASKTPKAKAKETLEGTPPPSSHRRGRFTFRRIETQTSSPGQRSSMGKSSAKISEGRLKLRQGDDLSEPLSSISRNNIALTDSKVVSPRVSRNVDEKRKTPKSAGKNKTPSPNQQSNLDIWITSRAKRMKGNKPFTYSNKLGRDVVATSTDIVTSDEDLICVSDDDDVEPTPAGDNDTRVDFLKELLSLKAVKPSNQEKETSHTDTHSPSHTPEQPANGDSGYCLNAAPVDKYGLTRRMALRVEQQEDSGSDTTMSENKELQPDTMVECPLCLGYFRASQIENHAAECSADVPTEEAQTQGQELVEEEMTECPVCGKMVEQVGLEDHATHCATTVFG